MELIPNKNATNVSNRSLFMEVNGQKITLVADVLCEKFDFLPIVILRKNNFYSINFIRWKVWFLYLKTATEQVIQINDNQYIMYYYKSLTKVQTFIIKQTTIYLSAGRIDGPQLFVLNIYMKWVIIYTSLLTILNIVTHARFYDDTRKVCDISTSYNFHRFSFQNCAALYFVTITV